MADSNQLYLGTNRSLVEIGEFFATTVHLKLKVKDNGTILVLRRLSDSEHLLSGELTPNFEESGKEPEWVEAMDGYPVQIELFLLPQNEAVLDVESVRLFEDLARLAPFPMLYTWRNAFLRAASRPGDEVHHFPPKTSPDVSGKHLWDPYALDRHALQD